MLTKIFGSAVFGIDATTITIEINVDHGVGYYLVGLADHAIKESSYRIAAALANTGYRLPGKRITINLAPANMRKEGSAYDLPIAMGILIASEQVKISLNETHYILMGELSLDGTLQSINGALPIAIKAKEEGYKGIILPKENQKEAAVVDGIDVYGLENIKEVIAFFEGKNTLEPYRLDFEKDIADQEEMLDRDFKDVKGQESIKRAMEIAASGGHNIILIGPPGSGKTMLAKRLASVNSNNK